MRGVGWAITMWLYRPDALSVWKNEDVVERLTWYRAVMLDRRPAKFMICKHVGLDEEPSVLSGLDEQELWRLHDRAVREFEKVFERVRDGLLELGELEPPCLSLLHLKVELAKRMLKACRFCVRRCRANRAEGQRGFCGLGREARVSTWFHHFGEEAPLLGGGGHPVGGSGTIFFTSCNLRCVFCQNYDISFYPENGVVVDGRRLAAIAAELRRERAANINFVGGEPTPNLHVILASMEHLDVNVPMLWNSNMLCSEEAMRLLIHVIDIWLPDFKFGNNACAERLTAGGVDYVSTVLANHKLAVENGDMIIRHLVMPNHVDCCTKPVLDMIARELGPERVLVNIMGQYRPEHLVARWPEKWPDIARRPSAKEMREAFEYARGLGLVFEPIS